jgi:hypothetical protein
MFRITTLIRLRGNPGCLGEDPFHENAVDGAVLFGLEVPGFIPIMPISNIETANRSETNNGKKVL